MMAVPPDMMSLPDTVKSPSICMSPVSLSMAALSTPSLSKNLVSPFVLIIKSLLGPLVFVT